MAGEPEATPPDDELDELLTRSGRPGVVREAPGRPAAGGLRAADPVLDPRDRLRAGPRPRTSTGYLIRSTIAGGTARPARRPVLRTRPGALDGRRGRRVRAGPSGGEASADQAGARERMRRSGAVATHVRAAMTRLAGKSAVITGAAKGIGGATADVFAAEGARLVLTDIDAAGLEARCRRLEAEGARGRPGRR